MNAGRREAGSDLAAQLRRWAAAGLISAAQADAVLAHERAHARDAAGPAGRGRGRGGQRVPVVAEALGYLGGVLATTGLVLAVSRWWSDLGTAGRLALAWGATAALIVAGALVDERADPALARLRWSLWAAATAAAGLSAGVVAVDGLGARAPDTVALAVALGVTVLSALLWAGRARPVQQCTFLGGLAVVAGTAAAQPLAAPAAGLVVWAVGAAYVALARRDAGGDPVLTGAVGAVVLVAGAGVTVGEAPGVGLPLGVVTALGLLAVGAVPGLARRPAEAVVATVVGAVSAAQAVPSAIGYFAQDAAGATGLVTWGTGTLLVLAAARGLVRAPLAAELLGAAAMLTGAAVTGAQWESFAPAFGVATSLALVALGTRPGAVVHSLTGSLGLLVYVPWAIAVWFPGEGRVPLLVFVAGVLVLGVAVLLTRGRGRRRAELRPPRPAPPAPGARA
ncbi:MAG: hypothetical protein KatS3mg009_0394 [Acidimicrobiia bacterium]|nr:MAG: hypothetical protein KatS3mg009_0394 [Acidimicrobiia bacterium]